MSTSPTKMAVIIDDLRGDAFTLSGGASWTVNKADQWFNGTVQSLVSAVDKTDPKDLATLQMKFNGTSVALFGTTPPASSSQTMSVSIDGSSASNTSYLDRNPPTYRQWYQSPILSDGLHTLSLNNIAGTALDFAVVTVGKDTPLNAQTVIVDNEDPAIVYSKKKGKWRQNQTPFNSGPNPDGVGYGNTTHDTTYVASSFSYKFSAVSIAIYGVRTWSQVGSLSVQFSIDGNPLTKNFDVKSDTPQFKAEVGQQQNFLFYSFDFLSAGPHTLTVNVTECVSQVFSFDYLTYSPNFPTFGQMPEVGIATNDDNGTGAAAGGGDSGKGSSSKGPIIGGVVAAVALLALIIGLAVFLRRRKRRNGGAGGRMGKKESAMKYSPLEPVPFSARAPGQVYVSSNSIPLAHQATPPPSNSTPYLDPSAPATAFTTNATPGTESSNSTALGPMARLQEASAVQYGLPFPHGPAASGQRMNVVNDDLVEKDPFNRGPPSPASRPGTSSGGQAGQAGNGELSPPSYDEVTGGQAPTHVTYVIQR